MSDLLYVGIDHHTAPVDIRECLSLSGSRLSRLIGALHSTTSPISEVVPLSTCNRVEIYALADDPEAAVAFIEDGLARAHDFPSSILRRHLTHTYGHSVASHLCRVATGLDSMVLGEAQILGQVVEAYEAALEHNTAGPVLAALFRKAIECGKKARTETAIGDSAVSVSYAAVELAKSTLGTLEARCVLLLGAGEMAQLAAENLCANSTGRFLVANRTYERAERLARRFGGRAYPWQALEDALCEADIVLCSTAAPQAIIHRDIVERVCHARGQRPLFMIDIAVPRNVDLRVAELENVHLYDIDDLQGVVRRNLGRREEEVPRVEALVQEATDEFAAWLAGREVVSTIRDLRQMAESICDDQVHRALNRLGPLSDREQRIVRTLGHNITNKLLHQPTVRLKEFARDGDAAQYADVLRALFALDSLSVDRQPRVE